MTEEEQIAFAMQMSMQDAAADTVTHRAKRQNIEEHAAAVDNVTHRIKRLKIEEQLPMDVDEDHSEVIGDAAFLQSVLENLPDIDTQSEAVRDAVGSLSKDKEKKTDDDASKK